MPATPRRDPGPAAAFGRLILGRPRRVSEASKEEITPVEGLPALSLDALTSVAYGPEAILVVLAATGASSLHLVLPITVAIVVLLAILVFSYCQVIDAYPSGGGAYAVSRANFGPRAAQLAAASLVVDYTLTVAVSIAAGVGQLTSAFPSLSGATVPICLGILGLITILNLRGLSESARAFLLPTLVFIVGLLAIIAVGLVHPLAAHAPQPGRVEVANRALETVSVLLVLKAFAAGCSALTGVEAIANGVPLFKPPRMKRAKRTELLLGTILGAMLLGLAELAVRFKIEPRAGQTALSQVMGAAVGRHWAYYTVSLAITIVLALAANTSFGGLPVLASLLARDHNLPHLFGQRGDRQTFTLGIVALAVLSGALLVASRGNTQSLIPLFAIGVFIGFTLAQSGLVLHWWRERPTGWQRRAAINALGALLTGVSTIVFLVSKFVAGAWVVAVAIPTFMFLFQRIERYYRRVAAVLELGQIPPRPEGTSTTVIVPVANISILTEHALSEALSLSDDVTAVTVVIEARAEETGGAEESGRDLEEEWERWQPGVPLKVLRTDYASIVQPLVRFIEEKDPRPERSVVVLIPVVVPQRLRYRVLHNHMDLLLSAALRDRTDVVVARVKMAVDTLPPKSRRRPRQHGAPRPGRPRGQAGAVRAGTASVASRRTRRERTAHPMAKAPDTASRMPGPSE